MTESYNQTCFGSFKGYRNCLENGHKEYGQSFKKQEKHATMKNMIKKLTYKKFDLQKVFLREEYLKVKKKAHHLDQNTDIPREEKHLNPSFKRLRWRQFFFNKATGWELSSAKVTNFPIP